jgi:hypothetical protein
MKKIKLDKRTKEQKLIDTLKMHRKINRELQLESGIVHKSAIFKDKTKYNRKDKSWKKDIDF